MEARGEVKPNLESGMLIVGPAPEARRFARGGGQEPGLEPASPQPWGLVTWLLGAGP